MQKKPNFEAQKVTENNFSDFIVYVDESGDHSLASVDKNYPIFVLAFCIFHKKYYANTIVSSIEEFKFKYFGHDLVILHEREIRKQENDFSILINRDIRTTFMEELSDLMKTNNFILLSCLIDKRELSPSYVEQNTNPYHIALKFCMETLYEFLIEKKQENQHTHIILEKRGAEEYKDIELAFRRIRDGNNKFQTLLPFSIRLTDKKANSTGLQFADLVARPIGRNYLDNTNENRAFQILKKKFYCRDGRKKTGNHYEGYGLKIFPPQKSEKSR